MLADELDFVVRVDTHRDLHAVGVVEARTGAVVFEATVPADGGGYVQAALQSPRPHAVAVAEAARRHPTRKQA